MTQAYDQFKNLITREASKNDNQQAQPRYGLVESYDADHNTVICSLLPEKTVDGQKILTNWLQIIEPLVGDGWGIVSPLEVGDQVIMLPMYNSGSEYVVLGATFNQKDLVAKGPDDIGAADTTTPIGDYLIRSKTGFTMKFVDNKTIMLKGDYHKEEMAHLITKGVDIHLTTSDFVHVECDTAVVDAKSKVTINSPETVINGHLQVNGSINASQDITDRLTSMETIREIYDIHLHDDSPPPDIQLPT